MDLDPFPFYLKYFVIFSSRPFFSTLLIKLKEALGAGLVNRAVNYNITLHLSS